MYKKNLADNYAKPPARGNPRGTEAWALTQAALRMKDAAAADDAEAMLAAVRLNWQLWTIFQAELLAPDCPVPAEIRNNVLSLAAFVDKHTVTVIAEPKPKDLTVLININRELAGGLFTKPPEDTPTDEQSDGGTPPQNPAGTGGVTA